MKHHPRHYGDALLRVVIDRNGKDLRRQVLSIGRHTDVWFRYAQHTRYYLATRWCGYSIRAPYPSTPTPTVPQRFAELFSAFQGLFALKSGTGCTYVPE